MSETCKNEKILVGLKKIVIITPCFRPIRNKGIIIQGIELIGREAPMILTACPIPPSLANLFPERFSEEYSGGGDKLLD